jgi:LL-diaminopimelate aminotransferase
MVRTMSHPSPALDLDLSPNSRLKQLPPYVFAYLAKLKEKARTERPDRPLIDLGMGNPDQPTPKPIIEALSKAIEDPANHGYPDFQGKRSFRQAVVRFMERRYGVALNPDTQVLPLIGSKEGITHLIHAYLEPGVCGIATPHHYPAYERASLLCGSSLYELAATEADGLPDLEQIPEEVIRKARLLMLNYPNNPTGQCASRAFWERAIAFCRKHAIVLLADLAYGEITFDGYRPDSVLALPGGADVAVEFHSFSKTFNMAGWRVGFVVGNPQVIESLNAMKSNMDYGLCNAVQDAATFALDSMESLVDPIVQEYQVRRDLLVQGFRDLGWTVEPPKGSFYLWLKTPKAMTSVAFVEKVLFEAGVVLTPGVAFGKQGDTHVRVSLVSPQSALTEALQRLKQAGIRYE